MTDTASVSASEWTETVAALRAARERWRRDAADCHDVARFPDKDAVAQGIAALIVALFPARLGRFRGSDQAEDAFVAKHLADALAAIERQLESELAYWQRESEAPFDAGHAATIVRLFAGELADIRERADADVRAAFLRDPAARSTDEVLVCYPGIVAILHHRIAHALHGLGAPIVARIISEMANDRTGIDIHPGATIGRGVFIDHGTGVVIGETAIVGDGVQIYQHVTLGACSPPGVADVPVRERLARHPIVGDDVVLYSGATILGRVTIGRGATIGGNVWLLDDVPPGSVVVQLAATILTGADPGHVRETLRGRSA